MSTPYKPLPIGLVVAIAACAVPVVDPDYEEGVALVECQYVPVFKSDFEKMSKFGRSKFRAAIVLRR